MSEPFQSAVVSSTAALGAAVPILRVGSLDVSLGYYVERLGFELQWRSGPVASVGATGPHSCWSKETRLDGERRRWTPQPDGSWRAAA